MPPLLLSTLQEPKKEEEEALGIFQILDKLEAAADNLLSRSVILNRRISWGSSRFLTGWRLQLTICSAGESLFEICTAYFTFYDEKVYLNMSNVCICIQV